MRLSTPQKLSLIFLSALLSLPFSVSGKTEKSIPGPRLSPGDHPAAETIFVPNTDDIPRAEPDPSWYVRAGAKKGLSGQADTDEELFASPDIAVLGRGFSALWPGIMAGYKEAVVPVRHDDIAGLSKTKPLLIIPSGALSGTEGSFFFRAGLAEYVRSGGTIFCLAQGNGSDFSALPVPEGQRLEAAGWSQDSGPLFGKAKIQVRHPLLAGIVRPDPLMETDGYFAAYPAGTQVLMADPHGFATMILYPVGKGWVLATTLFTDFSALLGSVHADEKILIKNILAWAKDPGKQTGASPQNTSSSTEKTGSTRPLPSVQAANPARTHLRVRASMERKGDVLKLSLEIPAQPGFVNQPLLVRTGEQEKPVTVSKDKQVVFFEMPVRRQHRISYAVYRANGRAVARGSIAVPHPGENRAVPDHPYYLAGDTAAVRFSGVGKGEITLVGMGFLSNMIIADRGSMTLPIPVDLPSGTYRMLWSFEGMRRGKKQGEFMIDLSGYRVAFEDALLERNTKGKQTWTAKFRIRTNQKISGRLSVMLRDPAGSAVNAADAVLSLVNGVQTVPVTFPFAQERGGIWELVYTLSATLPEGAGIPSEPAVIAAGSSLFDVGTSAVLAVVPDKSFYYEPSGPIEGTAIIAGKGRKTIQVELDNERTSREQIELAGISRYRFSLSQPEAGSHTVAVSVADDLGTSSRQQVVAFGLRLPDLALAVAPGGPKSGSHGPVMPVTMLVRNQGKTAAPASRIRLYDGLPSKDGKLITTLEVPELPARKQQKAVFDWPLYAKAGTRTLHAVADAENSVKESKKNNNTASADVVVPDILLSVNQEKKAFRAVDPVSLPVSVFNLTTRSLKALVLDMYIEDGPGGKRVSSEKTAIAELPEKSEKIVAPAFTLATPPAGTYRFSTGLAGGDQAAAAADFQILPTLQLTGTLDGTPGATVLCKRLSVKYRIKNAGNVSPSSGTVRLEIIPSFPGQPPVYSKQIPLIVGDQSITIDTAVLSRGTYTARLTASAKAEGGLSEEFRLAEKTLTVAGPLDVRRLNTSFPRVLVLLGRQGRKVQQAVSETIVKQAFSDEDLYFKIVDSAQEFAAKAMTGMFNTYVLFEPQEMPGTEWLKERLGQGQGIVIIGSGEIARSAAEDFGFEFDEAPSRKEADPLTFTDNTGLGLSGNLPVSGKILYPRKREAKTEAVYSDSGKPAALVDAPKGKIMVMPLSLSRSALNGATALYSLVLRKAALFVAPEIDFAPGQAYGQISVSSTAGPVNARIREVLSPGARVLWTNAKGKTEKNSVTWELKAGKDQTKLLYLYQPPVSEKTAPFTEVFSECGGRFVSQGKIE